jgi:hypothetical protein
LSEHDSIVAAARLLVVGRREGVVTSVSRGGVYLALRLCDDLMRYHG